MRSKGLLLVLLCLLCTCVFYLLVLPASEPLLASQQQSQSQQQHQQQQHPQQSSASPAAAAAAQHALPQSAPLHPRARLVTRDDRSDESLLLLRSLGFGPHPRTFPDDRWRNVSLPVFVSCVQPGQADLAAAFVRRFQATFPAHLLVLFTVALEDDEFDSVSAVHCCPSLLP